MEVEIISREFIQPSSPTPCHLKTHKFCLFDQFYDDSYARIVLYYPLNQDINLSKPTDNIDYIVSERLQVLKHSLSETLTLFYPLAGRVQDNISVDCNDEGIYFVEARAKNSLNAFLNQPNLSLISKFYPADDNEKTGRIEGAYAGKIQVTTFSCGGLAICPCFSHMLGDGLTMGLFLKNWTAIALKKTEEAISPNYNIASSLFPPKDKYPRNATWMAHFAPFNKTGRFVIRRFVFDAKAIENLKAKAASSSAQNPTRVEILSALLSKCVMAALQKKSGVHKPTLLTHFVNLRRRIKPAIADYSVGNLLWRANVLCFGEEVELDGLVYRLRQAIKKINGDFVNSLKGDGGFLYFYKALEDERNVLSSAAERIMFTSWCNFGFYKTDFGWGKPIWMSTTGPEESTINVMVNAIVLMDTRLGDGIDAWIFLPEEDMALLQLDQELLSLATLDPSPLKQDSMLARL